MMLEFIKTKTNKQANKKDRERVQIMANAGTAKLLPHLCAW